MAYKESERYQARIQRAVAGNATQYDDFSCIVPQVALGALGASFMRAIFAQLEMEFFFVSVCLSVCGAWLEGETGGDEEEIWVVRHLAVDCLCTGTGATWG